MVSGPIFQHKDPILQQEFQNIYNGIRENANDFAAEASNLGAANILINGGFEIWQRGTSFSTACYTADRWYYEGLTGGTATISREASEKRSAGGYSAKINITNAGTATSFAFRQLLENYLDYAGKTMTLSVWMKTSVAGMTIALHDGVITQSTAHPGDDAWHKLSITKTISATPSYLYLYACVTLAAPALGIIYIDDAMAVLGSQSVDYVPRPYAQELMLCRRYGQPVGAGISGAVEGTTVVGFGLLYNPPMRAAPTVTVLSQPTFRIGGGDQLAVGGTLANTYGSADAFWAQMSGFTGLTIGQFAQERLATNWLWADAEL